MTFITALFHMRMCSYVLVVQGLLQQFEFNAPQFGGLKEGRRREETPVEAVNTPFRELSNCWVEENKSNVTLMH